MSGKRITAAVLLAAVMVAALLSGCSGKSKTVLMVNGSSVGYDDYMIHLYYNKYNEFSSYIGSGSMKMSDLYNLSSDVLSQRSDNGVSYADYLKAMTDSSVMWYSLYGQLAKENNIKLTGTYKTMVDSSVSSLISSLGGAAAYNKFLKETGTTENALRRFYENQYLGLLLQSLFTEGGVYDLTADEKAAAKEQYKKTYVSINQIYLATVEESYGTKLSEATIAEKERLAGEAHAELEDGKDFSLIMNKYSEASGSAVTFAKDDASVDDKVETAAFNLGKNETSAVIKGSDGYYIIMRVDLTDDRLEDYYDSIRSAKLQTYLSEKAEASNVDYKKAYNDIVIK